MKNINELTEDCLIWLFCQFSIEELIELRTVCQLWAFIVEQVCRRKNSMKLFGSIENFAKFSQFLADHKLYLDKSLLLKPNGYELIGCYGNKELNLFPNVQNLVYYDLPRKLECILKAFPNIAKLTLFYENNENNELFKCLNQLTSLKELHLYENSLSTKINFPETSVLSKLESFSLFNYYVKTLSMLEQLGEPLRKLSLRVSINFGDFRQFFASKSEISSSLTHLSIKTCKENKEFFHFICANFLLLQSFEFGSISSLKQKEAILSLTKLKNLGSLIVDEMWDGVDSLITEKLEQIKTLQVTFNDYILDTFPRIDVGSIFPNLETFTVFTSNYKLLNSARNYFNDGLNLKTCKVTCKLICQDDLIFMGIHREQYEEEEQSRWEDEEDDRHVRNNGYILLNNV